MGEAIASICREVPIQPDPIEAWDGPSAGLGASGRLTVIDEERERVRRARIARGRAPTHAA
jgi:hypothetical protein